MAGKRKDLDNAAEVKQSPLRKKMKLMQVAPRRDQVDPEAPNTPNIPEQPRKRANAANATMVAAMLAKKGANLTAIKSEPVEATPTSVNQPMTNLENQLEAQPEGRAAAEIPESNVDRMAMVGNLDALDARLYNIGTQIEDLRKDYQSLFRKMIVERNETDNYGREVDQNGSGAFNNTDSEESKSSYHSYPSDESDN